ncbi:LacI family DNA-binding transcriptional regulator [Peterkaempfera griseoplana]|uniref:LacI family DNA-binding transcriptional regulator n=1 Tax=Peterkaempfera griseoplana TaxID=66896 RepID=UPI0006E3BF05|nr:LacI family DNA-binding transcriptional regulator [Peterkaempfera griseoplana]
MAAEGAGRVTIADIARAAGVSLPTVSRVLNGRGDVSRATRQRVEELLALHDYRRPAARSGHQAGLIDLVFNDLDSPWAVEILRGVEDFARASGLGTVVSAVHHQAPSAQQWLVNLRSRSSDGVILVTSDLAPELHTELHRLGVPTVVVDPAGVPTYDMPTVGSTNWTGGRSAVDHLLSLGHRRIGMIAGPPALLCSRARLDGYRAALELAGIEVDEQLIRQGDFHHECGFSEGARLLALDDPPTAIFASSDEMAVGVYEAARQHGLRIPDDLSVVGFDDLPQARWSPPPLTTVRQPLAEMGRTAADTLLQLVRGETPQTPRIELATQLVVRSSTAEAPAAPVRGRRTPRRPRGARTGPQ